VNSKTIQRYCTEFPSKIHQDILLTRRLVDVYGS
jgi:hypothetical protein